MNTELLLDVVLRWLHIFAAIAAVGGMFFMRFALAPTLANLPPELRDPIHEGVRGRWGIVVHAAILLLLVSGLTNIMRIINAYELPKFYHPLFGVKVLAAVAIFFIASMLMGRSEAARRFQQRRVYWLTINVALAILVVGISGILKTAPKSPKPAAVSSELPRGY